MTDRYESRASAGLDVEAVLRMFLTGDGYIAESDIPHIVAALANQAQATEIEARRAEVDALLDALRQITEWPDGGNRYGQEKIKRFARVVLDWIRMSDRKPTVDDADESGTVWVYDKVFADVSSVHFSRADSPYYTHWMPKEKRDAPLGPFYPGHGLPPHQETSP